MTPKSRFDFRLAAAVVFFIAVIGASILACYVKGSRQTDFGVYYSSVLAFREGLNPYDPADASKALGADEPNRFVYPPHMLFVYEPLTYLSYENAARVYLTIKLAAVAALMFFWLRIFDFKQHAYVLFLIAPLAFNSALLGDLGCGNVSTFEQFFIWAGFYFYSRDKPELFALFIVLASSFKFTPMVFLGILLTRWRKRDLICFAGGSVAFVLVLALNALLAPHMFAAFLGNVSTIRAEQGGLLNPTLLALANQIAAWIGQKTGHDLPQFLPTGIFGLAVLMVLGVAALTFQKLLFLKDKRADLWRICLICFVYALVLPRLKNYSYIVLVAPALYAVLSRPLANAWVPFCGLLIIFTYPQYNTMGTALAPFFHVQGAYYSLVIAWVIAALFCLSFFRTPTSFPTDEVLAPENELAKPGNKTISAAA